MVERIPRVINFTSCIEMSMSILLEIPQRRRQPITNSSTSKLSVRSTSSSLKNALTSVTSISKYEKRDLTSSRSICVLKSSNDKRPILFTSISSKMLESICQRLRDSCNSHRLRISLSARANSIESLTKILITTFITEMSEKMMKMKNKRPYKIEMSRNISCNFHQSTPPVKDMKRLSIVLGNESKNVTMVSALESLTAAVSRYSPTASMKTIANINMITAKMAHAQNRALMECTQARIMKRNLYIQGAIRRRRRVRRERMIFSTRMDVVAPPSANTGTTESAIAKPTMIESKPFHAQSGPKKKSASCATRRKRTSTRKMHAKHVSQVSTESERDTAMSAPPCLAR
mmetsp:Transcript_55874/g.149016  ORF Transcript_55874/g.149016 Transcript_55874/m.149016 type:complete len:346 (-) Transcript_55874:34-1071(-)